MKSKFDINAVKEAIISLNKSINVSETTKTLQGGKSTTWNILKNKEIIVQIFPHQTVHLNTV